VLIFRREKTASHTNMLRFSVSRTAGWTCVGLFVVLLIAWRTPAWFVVIVGAAGGIALAALPG
jgi:hypothetical protein